MVQTPMLTQSIPAKRPRRRVVWALLLMVAAQCLAVSCRSALTRTSHQPQAWNHQRGPVIPHDNFPTDCTLCHEPGSWHKIRPDFHFDHLAETGVPLIGAHATAQCLRCHNDRGPVASFANQGCVGCHQDIHRGQLGNNCGDCHSMADWLPQEQIARHNRTSFPLVGVHAGVACFRCHEGAQVGNFLWAPNECALCHQEDVTRASQPDHAALGWVQDCERCHTPTSWNHAQFNHSNFPLIGAHATASCSACHASNQFQGLPHDCFACHAADFQATTSPPHAAAGFSTDCRTCHTPVAWQGSAFVHNKFPLTGAHLAVACAACHQNGVYTGLSHDCVACHADDFQATTQPNHPTSGFSTNCQQCHSTSSWQGSSFAHTSFPLTGAHTSVACAACHQNGVYSGLSHDCLNCHLQDYQQATNPNHATAGFPMTCQNCHDTTRWQNANFQHTFNINSGPHRQFNCTECHRVPSNYAIVSCTHCHEHNQTAMEDRHRDENGYSWSSPACISCHPRGN